jgi:hypothetical protein
VPEKNAPVTFRPFESLAGGYGLNDGSIDFDLRVGRLADAAGIYLDLGAGRTAWFGDDA